MKREDFIKKLLKIVGDEIVEKNNFSSKYICDKGYLAEADLIAHNVIKQNIFYKYPNDQIVSEEDNLNLEEIKLESEYTWVIDPICGTTNFIYGFPFFSHSISLLKKDTLYATGVFDPLRKELFYSFDKKFYINDMLYKIDKTKSLKDSLISFNTNQSSEKEENTLKNIIKKLSPPISRRNKILESANLELAYVACGRLDAYFNPTDKPWDIASGILMVPSAGGSIKIFDDSGKNFFQNKGIIAASSQSLLNQIIKALNV